MFENPRRGRQAGNFTKKVPKVLDLKSSSENWRWVPLTNHCQCTNHCQSSNKPNTGELNDFAIPEYCGVMVMGRHLLDRERLIVRGVYYKQCVESRLIWDKSPAFIWIWKGASTRSCISFDVSVSLVKHTNDDLLYFDQWTNVKSSGPFRTVLRLDDKLRVTDILEECKSRVEEGCDKKQERD